MFRSPPTRLRFLQRTPRLLQGAPQIVCLNSKTSSKAANNNNNNSNTATNSNINNNNNKQQRSVAASSGGTGGAVGNHNNNNNHNNISHSSSELVFSHPGLADLRIAAYHEDTCIQDTIDGRKQQAVAMGHVLAQLDDHTLAVEFEEGLFHRALLRHGERVYVAYQRDESAAAAAAAAGGGRGSGPAAGPAPPPPPSSSSKTGESHQSSSYFLMGGTVVKSNANGTVGVLLDNNSIDLAVPRDKIFYTDGVMSFVHSPDFVAIVAWVNSAGVRSLQDQISTAVVLYRRGWRADRLYLLEMSDINLLNHLCKSDRMSLMEKAEWQRDHHRQMQSIYKERIKEKDKRYLFSKYAGILSASVAFVGASSLFGWNYKNYLKKTREYQLSFAVDTLCRQPSASSSASSVVGSTANSSANSTAITSTPTQASATGGGGSSSSSSSSSTADDTPGTVRRPEEERWVRQILMRLDILHPRVVVLTGYIGCGKSTLVRQVLRDCGTSCVFVDVRSKEDTLRSVMKALGVPDVDACGDPTDFIAEACMQAKTRMRGKIPLLVLKLRGEDSLSRVYNEAVTLACDRRVCHLVIEVPMESLTMANTSLPRLDFYTVPTFSRAQAYEYTQHRIDALEMEYFLGVVGTNSNDLDELFSSALQRHITPAEYARQKLLRAMRQLQNAWAHSARVKRALKQLSNFPYSEGQREGIDEMSLRDPALRDVVLYNPVQDCWVFASQVLHTAARCCL